MDLQPRYADAELTMHADETPTMIMTITRVTQGGRVWVTALVDGKQVAKGLANGANTSVNIVGTPGEGLVVQ